MKKSIHLLFVTAAIQFLLISCNDKTPVPSSNDIKFLSVVRIDCTSMVPECNNRPGLQFNAFSFGKFDMNPDSTDNYRAEPYHIIICCTHIPAFIDSLKKLRAIYDEWEHIKPDSVTRTCVLEDGTFIQITHTNNILGLGEFRSMFFGRQGVPVFYFFTKEDYEKLMEQLEERFRTCCLQ